MKNPNFAFILVIIFVLFQISFAQTEEIGTPCKEIKVGMKARTKTSKAFF